MAIGGPAALLASYVFITTIIYLFITGMAEVAAYLPVHGAGMSYQGFRYVSRSMGFAMGYLYWYSLAILVAYELTACAMIISYWIDINDAVWISIILVVVVAINFLPVRAYGEIEFWLCGIKIITIVGLVIVSLVIILGGAPDHDRKGFRYWNNPGALNEYIVSGHVGRFVGLLAGIQKSSNAFVFGPELVIQAGSEMVSPRRNIPPAAHSFVYRLICFYVFGAVSIGVICPSSDKRLLSSTEGAMSSPFVVGIKIAGIPVLDHIINAAILIAAMSAANAFLYMSSRALYSLAMSGDAPRLFRTCNRRGVPYYAVGASSLFGCLAYLSVGSSSSIVFNWLINFTNTSGFISWICCCIVYFRFRRAIHHQGAEKPYSSVVQPWGTWIGLAGAVFLTLINGFTVFFPSKWSVNDFFTAYIGIPAFLALYFGHRIVFWKDPWAWRSEDVDLHTGLQDVLETEGISPVSSSTSAVRVRGLVPWKSKP